MSHFFGAAMNVASDIAKLFIFVICLFFVFKWEIVSEKGNLGHRRVEVMEAGDKPRLEFLEHC